VNLYRQKILLHKLPS